MSRQNEKSAETRSRILDAAWRLLERQHGRGVRVQDIAAAARLSRQAVYLHFPSRAELLIATTRHIDRALGLEQRLQPSRSAAGGVARLDAYIAFWGEYLPEIHGVIKALQATQDTDEAAAAAWRDRMQAMRDGCRAAIEMLSRERMLASVWTEEEATDLLWTLLSVPNWERLTRHCGWSTARYIERLQTLARRALLAGPEDTEAAATPAN